MFDNVDGHNANSQTNSFNDDSHKTNSMVESIIPWRIWLKISSSLNDPWNQLRYIKWMNKRANGRTAYVPTEIEHIANVVTHGIWVIPAIYAALQLLWRSHSSSQIVVAIVYGSSLALLFIVSTIFHSVFYCNHNRQLKDVMHRCDRAVIYIFIAGSYFPWLSLSTTVHSSFLFFSLKWTVWLLAALGILYQQIYHERYKCLETLLYIVMGLGPSILIITLGHEFSGMSELKMGGLMYLIGIFFFKADGSIPMAHAIWHLFVVIAASFHYFAILNYLFPSDI
ncbi:hypothetical protein HA402_015899 [Bradysia odoriphaga]|nr:hypothetical protein HA402_015899 [Bradysia odoriphaga]